MTWKSRAAAIIGIAASIAAVYLALADAPGGSVAFAQVIEKLRTAETLSFDSVIKSVADGKVLNKSRNLYMIPGKLRTDIEGGNGESGYVVFDIPGGKVLMVDSKRKTARLSPLKRGEGNDMAAKAIEDVRSLEEQDSRPLGERQIDGKQAKGFEIDRENATTTVWADAATGEPVRIELLQKNFPTVPIVQVWTNIKLDEKLDPKLFSVEPPRGSTVTPFLTIDLNATPAEHVAKFLEIYAKHMNGKFPPRLQDALKLLAEKLGLPKANEAPSEEAMQLSFHGAAIGAILIHGRQGENWQYYPGHALGEKDQMVFWFHDRKKDQYLAVFGDLRVETVANEQLPPTAGEPAEGQ